MGYFKRQLRRSAARRDRLAFLDPAREIRPADWERCDLSIEPDQTYLRFVIDTYHAGKVGLFRSSKRIENDIELPAALQAVSREVYRWFNANLPIPSRLPKNAVCWFRSDAKASLRKLRTLVEVFRVAGLTVWMQASNTPGRIVYRDEYQVAAVPYADRRVTASVM